MKINGKKISETRKLKGLTQEELAEKSKMNLGLFNGLKIMKVFHEVSL